MEGRPALKKEVDKIAEVAGYLWQNGWAERNGGNITVNITDLIDDGIRQMKPISEPIQIGETLPHLKGTYSSAREPRSGCATLPESLWTTAV